MTRIAGRFQSLVFSPKGTVEGVLLDADGSPVQLVFERHDDVSPAAFVALDEGQAVVVEGEAAGASSKGEAEHAVYDFGRLVSVDGRRPPKAAAPGEPAVAGTVVRFNYARHGAANGVVLDSGDFVHLKPEGMARLKLRIGDAVKADGPTRPLATGGGRVVEAVNVTRRRKRAAAAG